ncbi:MAG: lysophospholipid acyltransferase family protein, partial [Verrucomicrobiota bacterium]|nr:lysophospholipid acyltransferase family protein [Verrucomicrobiota bacterium]
KGLGRWTLTTMPKLRRVGLRNLEIAYPNLSLGEREHLLVGSMENLGRILGEFSHIDRASKESLGALIDLRVPPEKLARYQEEKAKGRGVIFVTPHLGNWEIMVLALSALVEPITYLARPLDNWLLDRFAAKKRMRFGNRPISKRDALMEGMRILDAGGTLGLLADVNTLQRDGVFVPFFGVPASTTRAVAMLALRTNALILPMCGVWDEKTQRYLAIVGEFVEAVRTGNRKRDIMETTALFTAQFENFIRAYPEQWIWIHRRWKIRPKGTPDLYEGI